MTRRILALLLLALPLSASRATVSATAVPEEKRVLVRVDGAPAGALLVAGVYREVSGSGPVFLAEVRFKAAPDGSAEAACPVGDELVVPGLYRLKVSAGPDEPPVGEAAFEVGGGAAFLALVREQEAVLSKGLAAAGELLDRVNELEAKAHAAPDGAARAAVVKEWEAWRGPALAPLWELQGRASKDGARAFPLTWNGFVLGFLMPTEIQMESRRLIAVRQGSTAAAPHGVKSEPLVRADLDPFQALFFREAARYRLQAVNDLYQAFEKDPAALPRMREKWEGILKAAEEGPPGFPHAQALRDLAAAMRALWDAAPDALPAAKEKVRSSFKILQEKAGS